MGKCRTDPPRPKNSKTIPTRNRWTIIHKLARCSLNWFAPLALAARMPSSISGHQTSVAKKLSHIKPDSTRSATGVAVARPSRF